MTLNELRNAGQGPEILALPMGRELSNVPGAKRSGPFAHKVRIIYNPSPFAYEIRNRLTPFRIVQLPEERRSRLMAICSRA